MELNLKFRNPGPATEISEKSSKLFKRIPCISLANITGDCLVFFAKTKAMLDDRSKLNSSGGTSIATPSKFTLIPILRFSEFEMTESCIFFLYI